MGSDGDMQTARFGLLDRDEVEGVLSGSFYTPRGPRRDPRRTRSRRTTR